MTTRLSTGLQNALAGNDVELVPYGAMTVDATVQSNWTESGSTMLGAVSNHGQTCMSLNGAGYASTAITTKIGHWYKLSFAFDNEDTTGYASVVVGTSPNASTNLDTGNLAQTVGTWTTSYHSFRATATTTYITLKNSGASIKYFDSVSCSSLSNSIKDAFHLGCIKIYSGTQPTDADDAPTGVLLVTIQNGGSGLTFQNAVDGVLSKTSTETWSGTCVASGTAGWFRLQAAGDLGTDNETDCRIDGTIATSGGEINFTSTSFTLGATQTISDYHPTVEMSV